MKMLWELSREAIRYKGLYMLAIFATLSLTLVNLAGKRTIIAIAHRLSTIRTTDQILVIEKGRVKERGTHEDLLKLGGTYAHMNDIQTNDA